MAQLCKAVDDITLCRTCAVQLYYRFPNIARLPLLEAAAECCSQHRLTDQPRSLHTSLGNERQVQAPL